MCRTISGIATSNRLGPLRDRHRRGGSAGGGSASPGRWYDPTDSSIQLETVPINTALGLLAVCLLIAASAVFVAAEFALVAADRNRIEQRAAEGSRSAGTALGLLKRLSFHLSGAQLGITLVSLALGFIAEPIIAQLIEPVVEPIAGGATSTVSIILALFLATVLQMVLGELIPKGLAIAAPERASIMLAPYVRIYGVIFGPLISFLNGAANATVRRLGIEPQEELSHVRTLRELSLVIQASAEGGTIAGSASDLLTRSIRFGEKTAADVLGAAGRGPGARQRRDRRRPRRPVGRDRALPLPDLRRRPRRHRGRRPREGGAGRAPRASRPRWRWAP